MAKELRFNSPNKQHPAEINLSMLFKDPKPSHKIKVYIEWQDGTYGSKVPVVIVEAE